MACLLASVLILPLSQTRLDINGPSYDAYKKNLPGLFRD